MLGGKGGEGGATGAANFLIFEEMEVDSKFKSPPFCVGMGGGCHALSVFPCAYFLLYSPPYCVEQRGGSGRAACGALFVHVCVCGCVCVCLEVKKGSGVGWLACLFFDP